jgi:uncharacterized membrane protein
MQSGFMAALYFLNPALSVIFIITCILKHSKPTHILSKTDPFLFVFILFVFIGSFSYFRQGFNDFANAEWIHITIDALWHMGNINALTQSFPPMDPHVANSVFSYHYFNELFLAICKMITGLPSSTLALACTPYLMSFIFCLANYSFIKEYTAKKRRT